jgi:hypothetical protein
VDKMSRVGFEIQVPLFRAGAGVKGDEKEGIQPSSMCGGRGFWFRGILRGNPMIQRGGCP